MPYTPEWWLLQDAIEQFRRVTGASAEDAAKALSVPLREDSIASRIPGEGGMITPERWYTARLSLNDGTVEFGDTPWQPWPAGLDRPRFHVEVRCKDVLRRWPEPDPSPSADPPTADSPSTRAAKVPRVGRKAAPFWAEAKRVATKWLEDQGCPAPGDGEQAKLEGHIADWLSKHGHQAGEATIRRYVANWIAARRNELGVRMTGEAR